MARARQPLILSGHGVSLRIHHGALEVRNGFTHYPQSREEARFFPGDWRQPSRIVVIDGNGTLTFDVLTWLAMQGIPLIRLDWRGNVQVIAGAGYAATPKLVEAQRRVQSNGTQRMALCVRMVAEKLARSAATLRACSPATDARRDALAELAKSTQDIKVRPPRTVNDLRGIEGRAAVAYFRAWRSLPLHWKGVGRHPIPEDWHHIVARARPNRVINRRATHPMNAILNYSYALLQSQIHIAVVGAGLDPTVGLMHTDRPDRPAFVLDLMEPLRPVVDTTALQFVQANTFAPQDFTIGADGTCRLHPALARRVVSEIGDIRGVESLVADFLGRVGRRNLRTVTPRPHHRISAAANER